MIFASARRTPLILIPGARARGLRRYSWLRIEKRRSLHVRRHSALSFSWRSPTLNAPTACRQNRRHRSSLTPDTFFQRRHFRTRSSGSSSRSSRVRHCLKLSLDALRLPPGKAQRPSRRRFTSKALTPSWVRATSLAALGLFAISPTTRNRCSLGLWNILSDCG